MEMSEFWLYLTLLIFRTPLLFDLNKHFFTSIIYLKHTVVAIIITLKYIKNIIIIYYGEFISII